MEINSPVSKSAAAAPVYTQNRETVPGEQTPEDKKFDKFIKSIDSYLENQRRQQKYEEKLAKQNAADAAVRKRRRMKLLLKKHNDYLRFLEGTALKRSIAERERIRDPLSTEAEITNKADAVTNAESPLFIRIR